MHDREERDRGMVFVDGRRRRALGLCNSGDDDNDDGLDRWSKKSGASATVGLARPAQLPEGRKSQVVTDLLPEGFRCFHVSNGISTSTSSLIPMFVREPELNQKREGGRNN